MAHEIDVLKALGKRYRGTGMTDLGNPADTLLATVLSAQTTDVQVLKVFPSFRRAFPNWKSLAEAKWTDIAKTINTVGLYRSKAKALKGLARIILDDYGGRVPSTMEDLLRLPGVGRKTASVVLSFSFGQPAIAVDTHVFRIVRRLGWSKGKDAKRVEQDLMKRVPKTMWSEINRTMVPFGRDVCQARLPQCWRCPVAKWCAYPHKTPHP
jgi:endonuclease-3